MLAAIRSPVSQAGGRKDDPAASVCYGHAGANRLQNWRFAEYSHFCPVENGIKPLYRSLIAGVHRRPGVPVPSSLSSFCSATQEPLYHTFEKKAGDRHMENKPAQNIQDTFLNTVRKDKTPITIYLVSGVKLTGKIRSFDKYSVLLENNSQEQLIFKHAISTVVSNRSVMHGEHRPAAVSSGIGPAPVPMPSVSSATAEQR
jgi:host factor-I protein